MIIPYQEISTGALQSLLESFVTRQGADQFDTTYSLEDKVVQVRKMLEQGEVVILWDPMMESCNLVTREEATRMND